MTSTDDDATISDKLFRDDRKVIYINLVVIDPSDAIDRKLSEKLKGKVCQPLVKVASKVATTLATPERVAVVMAEKLPGKIVEKMATKGLTAAAETVFCEGPYVVVQFQIQSASPQAMIEAQSKDSYDDSGQLEQKASLTEDFATTLQRWLNHFLTIIGLHHQKSLEDEYLPKFVQDKLESIMGDVLADKLNTKGMKAISNVSPEASQARFFYETLGELRQTKESNKPRVKLQKAAASAKVDIQSKAANIKASTVRSKEDTASATNGTSKFPFSYLKKKGEKFA